MSGRSLLRPASAGAALAFAEAVRSRGSRAQPTSGPVALVHLRQPARQESRRQQQINIQHSVKMTLQAYLRGQPQPRRSPPSPALVGQTAQAVLPALVRSIGDHILRQARRSRPPYRVPGRERDVIAGLAFYRPTHGLALAFRRDGRSPGELHNQVQRITRQIQSKVVDEITHTLPWRTRLNDVLRSPEVLRQLTDHLTRAIDRRADIDRYRRGG